MSSTARCRTRLDETTSAVNEVLAEIGADELPVELVLNKIDTVDPLGRRRLAEPLPGRYRSRRDRRGPGRAEGENRRALRRAVRAGSHARPVRGRREARRAVLARPPIDERVDGPDGVFIRAAAAARDAAFCAVSDPRRGGAQPGNAVIEVPVRRLREDAVIPSQAYSGDAGLDLSACERHELGPASGRWCRPASPSRFPRDTEASSCHAPLAARNGITLVNAPGLIDAGSRGGAGRHAEHGRRDAVRRRARNARCAARLPVPAVDLVELEELPASERAGRGFDRGLNAPPGDARLLLTRDHGARADPPPRQGCRALARRMRSRLGAREPEAGQHAGRGIRPGGRRARIRVSAILRRSGACCSAGTRSTARSTLPGGGVNSGESLVDALHRSSRRRSAWGRTFRSRDLSRSSTRSHLRGASRRSMSCTSSSRETSATGRSKQ